jgi:pilus assembly protein CpaF
MAVVVDLIAVDLIDRLVDRVVASSVPLDEEAISAELGRLLPEEAPLAPPGTVQDVIDALVGLGPIERLLRQPDVTDVLVNGDGTVWVERRGELERAAVRFSGPEAVVAAVERTLAPLGLRLDQASPMVDARLADGSRLHAVIPPVAVDGPVVAVRRFTAAVPDLGALVAGGGVDEDGAGQLAQAVADRRNLVVSGGTGAGKTTLLNVLSTEIPADERVVAVEDTAELRLAGHVVRLEARPANAEGAGAVTLQDLVRTALRLRPDRIIVGEVRGPEALDLVSALNTGHDGSMSTVHANSAEEALWRLETLALSGRRRAGEQAIHRQLLTGIDLVVQVVRRRGVRRIQSIAEVGPEGCVERWRW